MDYRDGFVSANGLRFHYLAWGDPTAFPVILLHGTTSNAHSWDMVAPALARRYRVLALDARNHGLSDSGPTGGNLVLADDVRAIADALGIDRFHLIGLSMGGRTAMIVAGLNPGRVERLAIEDIGPETPPAASARVMTVIRSSPTVVSSPDDLLPTMRQNLPFASDEWLRYSASHRVRPREDGGYDLLFRQMPPGPGMTTEELWELIAGIACPTLIVRGAESDILTAAITARMIAAMPDATEVVIPRAAHVVHEDNPTDTIRAYTEFFGVPTA